jgi:hypothetical protein
VNDRAAERDIYLTARIDRTFRVPWGETGGTIPDAATRAGKFLAFDLSGSPTVGSAVGPPGPAPNLSIGTVSTGAAAVSITGTNPNYTLNFTVPQGPTGPAPGLVMGTVTTGAAGSSASANFTGTGPYTLNLTIPRGDTGLSGALSNGTYGDIIVTGAGATLTVGPAVITYSKIQNVSATGRLLGRNSAGAGVIEELDAATSKTLLGLNNLDNTSDANKPVSTAQQTALDTKANANDAALTGNPTAPTPALRDADTSIATMAALDRLYDVEQVTKTAVYTLTIGDRGRTVTTNSNVHVPPNSSVAFPVGSFVEIYNNSGGNKTVDFSSGTDVFRKHGVASTVTTLTLPTRSIGQLRKVDIATEWLAIGFS